MQTTMRSPAHAGSPLIANLLGVTAEGRQLGRVYLCVDDRGWPGRIINDLVGDHVLPSTGQASWGTPSSMP
jgi:hypothetical protein